MDVINRFAVCATAALSLIAAASAQASNPRPEAFSEPPWGETVEGLRMRLTAVRGTEYRRGMVLPLTVELQNVGEKPVAFNRFCGVTAEAKTEKNIAYIAAGPADYPWDGRKGALAPGEVARWTQRFDQLRYQRFDEFKYKYEIPPAGSKLDLRFRATVLRENAAQEKNYEPLQVDSNWIRMDLKDAPDCPLTKDNMPDKWRDELDFRYGEGAGIGGNLGMHISGDGRVTLVVGPGPAAWFFSQGRYEAKLEKGRLDELAKSLRELEVWKLADTELEMPRPDEFVIGLILSSGGYSLQCSCPQHVWNERPQILELRKITRRLLSLADDAARKTPDGWGPSDSGVQARLRTESAAWKAGAHPVFTADLRNNGTRPFVVMPTMSGCSLEYDGAHYRWGGALDLSRFRLRPGQVRSDVRLILDDQWQSVDGESHKLELSPGSHLVRVEFYTEGSSRADTEQRHMTSNLVEILVDEGPSKSPETGR